MAITKLVLTNPSLGEIGEKGGSYLKIYLGIGENRSS
jgi:hypothetical protein